MLVAVFLAWTTLQLIDNTLALAFTTRRTATISSSSIIQPRSLTDTIPACATSCLQSFIQNSFASTTCQDQEDLNCLCTNPGIQGFTLGEGALQCVASNCVNPSPNQFQQVYAICSGVSGAILPTHAVITASVRAPTTILIPTAIPTTTFSIRTIPSENPSTISADSSPGSSGTIRPTTSTRSTSQTSQTPSSSSITSTGSASAATSGSTSQPVTSSPVLTKSQIIGLSVGLGVLALIAMALLAWICCFRGRDRRESSLSWGTNQPLMSRYDNPDGFSTSPGMPQVNPYVPSKAQSVLGQHYPAWSPVASPQRDFPITNMGLAISPRYDDHHYTPGSAATYQTTSRLLPEKPSLQPPPRPPRDGTEGVILTNPSAARTRPSPSKLKASPDSFNSGPIIYKKPSDPFMRMQGGLYSPPRTINHERASRMDLPRLDTRPTQSITQQQYLQPPVATYNPANYAHFAESEIYDRGHQSQSPRRDSVLPGTAMTTNVATVSTTRSIPRKEAPITFNKYKPIPPSKKRPAAASTVTSFESDGEYAPTRKSPRIPALPAMRNLTKQTPVQRSAYDAGSSREIGQSTRLQPTPPVPDVQSSSSTPLSQIRYPTVPSLTQTPVSQENLALKPNPLQTYSQRRLQQDSNSHEVSPVSPQIRRKENFILPQWQRLPANDQNTTRSNLPPSSLGPHPAELSALSELEDKQNSWKRTLPGTGSTANPQTSNPIDVSYLYNSGYAELPERGSSKRWSQDDNTIKIALEQKSTGMTGSQTTRSQPSSHVTGSHPARAQLQASGPLAIPPARFQQMTISELPSPDAERLIDPLARAGESLSPKKESRGARLGAAMASKTPIARPRGASVGQETSPAKSNTLQPYYQYPSTTSASRYQTSPPPGVHLAPSRPPLSRENTGGTSPDVNENIRGTAKWTVLCAPGQL